MMGVEEYGGSSVRRSRNLPVNRRMGVLQIKETHPLEARRFQLCGCRKCGAADSGRIEPRRTDRLDPDQFLQVGP